MESYTEYTTKINYYKSENKNDIPSYLALNRFSYAIKNINKNNF